MTCVGASAFLKAFCTRSFWLVRRLGASAMAVRIQVVAKSEVMSILMAMELAAVIIVIVSAALVAAAFAAAAFAAGRVWRFPYKIHWIAIGGAAFGAVLGISVVTGFPASLFRPSGDEPVEAVIPYMKAFNLHEPVFFERLQTLIERDRQDGRSEEEVRVNAMSLALSYVADKAALLPDSLVYEHYSFIRDELAHFGATREFEACADISLGRIRGDLDGKLSPELRERHNTIVLRIIETLANPDAPRMSAEQFAVLAAQSFAAASQTVGIPANEVDSLLSGSGDPAQVCKLMKGFFDELLAQPIDISASALRQLAAGERASN
jgi:hypothetical protein